MESAAQHDRGAMQAESLKPVHNIGQESQLLHTQQSDQFKHDSHKTHVTETQVNSQVSHHFDDNEMQYETLDGIAQDVSPKRAVDVHPKALGGKSQPKAGFLSRPAIFGDGVPTFVYEKAKDRQTLNLGRKQTQVSTPGLPAVDEVPGKVTKTVNDHGEPKDQGAEARASLNEKAPLGASPQVRERLACSDPHRSIEAHNDRMHGQPQISAHLRQPPDDHLENRIPKNSHGRALTSQNISPYPIPIAGMIPILPVDDQSAVTTSGSRHLLDATSDNAMKDMPQATRSILVPTSGNTLRADPGKKTQLSAESSASKSPRGPETGSTPSRVRKNRRKSKQKTGSKSLVGAGSVARSGIPKDTPSVDCLLMLLSYYKHNSQKERNEAVELQRTKDAELDVTRRTVVDLNRQIEEVRERSEKGNQELRKYQKATPGWEKRLRELSAYIEELKKDYCKLRDDATAMMRQQTTLLNDKVDLVSAVKGSCLENDRQSGRATRVMKEARTIIKNLEQTVKNSERKYEESMSLLEAEEDRNDYLENEVASISVNQQRLLEMMGDCRSSIADKIDEIISWSMTPSKPTSNMEGSSIFLLEQCLGLLQESRNRGSATTEDFQRLATTLQAYGNRLATIIQEGVTASKSVMSAQEVLESKTSERLETLLTEVRTEKSAVEQISGLREIKAALQERLRASETALIEARKRTMILQDREKVMGQDNQNLRADMERLRRQPVDSTSTTLHLQKLERANIELQASVGKAQSDIFDLSEGLKCRDEKLSNLQGELFQREIQLEEVQAANVALQEVNLKLADQGRRDVEDLRAKLLKAANVEKTNLANETANTIHQLERQKRLAESRLELVENQLQMSNSAKENERDASKQLGARIVELHDQMGDNKSQLADLKESLRLSEETVQAKDMEIRTLLDGRAEHQRKLEETEIGLALARTESNSKEREVVARINALCKDVDPQVLEQDNLEDALECLLRLSKSTEMTKQVSKLTELGSAVEENKPRISESASLPGSATTDTRRPRGNDTPIRPKRKANRSMSSFAGRVRYSNKQRDILEQTETEEVTVQRSVKKTVSSRGHNGLLEYPDPKALHIRQRNVNSIVPFSYFQPANHESFREQLPSSDPANLFPPTPTQVSREWRKSPSITSRTDDMAMRDDSCDLRKPSQEPQRPSEERAKPSKSAETRVNPEESRTRQQGENSPIREPSLQQVVPRGILKDPKPTKRNTTTAGLEIMGPPRTTRRLGALQNQGLGPVIPEPGSPIGSRARIGARRQSRRAQRRVSTENKYQKRFLQELQ